MIVAALAHVSRSAKCSKAFAVCMWIMTLLVVMLVHFISCELTAYHCCAGWACGDHHAESSPVQNPRLVPQQAEGRQGRQIQPGRRQFSVQHLDLSGLGSGVLLGFSLVIRSSVISLLSLNCRCIGRNRTWAESYFNHPLTEEMLSCSFYTLNWVWSIYSELWLLLCYWLGNVSNEHLLLI